MRMHMRIELHYANYVNEMLLVILFIIRVTNLHTQGHAGGLIRRIVPRLRLSACETERDIHGFPLSRALLDTGHWHT